jgi:hypothetical protein
MYEREALVVQEAIRELELEHDPRLIGEVERQQRTASTSLEWYGITKSAFEKLLDSNAVRARTAERLLDAIQAIKVMYGSAG